MYTPLFPLNDDPTVQLDQQYARALLREIRESEQFNLVVSVDEVDQEHREKAVFEFLALLHRAAQHQSDERNNFKG